MDKIQLVCEPKRATILGFFCLFVLFIYFLSRKWPYLDEMEEQGSMSVYSTRSFLGNRFPPFLK